MKLYEKVEKFIAALLRHIFWVWWPLVCFVQALTLPETGKRIFEFSSALDGDVPTVLLGSFASLVLFCIWIAFWGYCSALLSRQVFDGHHHWKIYLIWVGINAAFLTGYNTGWVTPY